MAELVTLQEFYQKKFNYLPDTLQQDIGHFNVFCIEDYLSAGTVPVRLNRRDFYKISLVRGKSRYHFADKSIETQDSTLLFFNPQMPYTREQVSDRITGFFCIFNEAFFREQNPVSLHELPMFRAGGQLAYPLSDQQNQDITVLFQKMSGEIDSTYRYKYDLIRNYVSELIHAALKLAPSETLYQHPDAKSRITAVFTELLERQFPIESPTQRFALRSASDFARYLSVHVNYLNRSIRETTGKTTTDHIAERLVSEARALLKHTDWPISEISYSLGFDEPTHFNNFFKKKTQLTPSFFRQG